MRLGLWVTLALVLLVCTIWLLRHFLRYRNNRFDVVGNYSQLGKKLNKRTSGVVQPSHTTDTTKVANPSRILPRNTPPDDPTG